MFELKVISHLAAAHQLKDLGGPCERLHGHNWKIEVCVRGENLEQNGLLIDFKALKQAADQVLQEMDHRFLNELQPFQDRSPSSENIAQHVFRSLARRLNGDRVKVWSVTAWESETACATYTEP
ncbi:MAG: 6-carboxytetrahydropterin synthase QueD [Thermodesulfobacteriota bacterium]